MKRDWLNVRYADINTLSRDDLLEAERQLAPLARRYYREYADVWYNNQSEVTARIYAKITETLRKNGVSASLAPRYFSYASARARQHFAREIEAAPLYHAVQTRLEQR